MKFTEAAHNFTKLGKVRKNFTKFIFIKFVNNFTKLWDSATTFGKSLRPTKNIWKQAKMNTYQDKKNRHSKDFQRRSQKIFFDSSVNNLTKYKL